MRRVFVFAVLTGLSTCAMSQPDALAETEPERRARLKAAVDAMVKECEPAGDFGFCSFRYANEHLRSLSPDDVKFTRDEARDEIRLREERKEAQAKAARMEQEKACRKAGFKDEAVRIGMRAKQVRACGWGDPESINRTTTARGTREQWVYGDGNYLYFENGVLVTIQN